MTAGIFDTGFRGPRYCGAKRFRGKFPIVKTRVPATFESFKTELARLTGFLDAARRELAIDILQHNDRAEVLCEGRLNDAVQSIVDRLFFLLIAEARGIDTGMRLRSRVKHWRHARARRPRQSLWRAVVRCIRAVDRRAPNHLPFFSGKLFTPHWSEELVIGDAWIAQFIAELSDAPSPYLLNVIPVEILGSVYERFLGSIVRRHGRGVVIEDKPEVRKAGGVYYTPRYVVDYIVEQTVGRQLDAISRAKTFASFEKKTRALRLLDPACGSGCFLIRAFERLAEHWRLRLTRCPKDRKKELCWVDPDTGELRLTIELKRRILRDNIYGVDKDEQAVEVTQLSLYLKMLEGENRTTLRRQRSLFSSDVTLLPPLQDNIRCGNSLIACDFSRVSDELLRVNAFDFSTGFRDIMTAGGFDAVIGNPPWGSELDKQQLDYLRQNHREIIVRMIDAYMYFVNSGLRFLRKDGAFGMILPDVILYQSDTQKLRRILAVDTNITSVANLGNVFDQVIRPACIIVCVKSPPKDNRVQVIDLTTESESIKARYLTDAAKFQEVAQSKFLEAPGCLFTTRDLARFELWNRLRSGNHLPLSDMVDGDGLQRGVSPDLKEAFLVDAATARSWELEAEHLRPTVTGGKQVKRYCIEQSDINLIYTSRDNDFEQLPHICRYIDQYRKRITCKEVIEKKHSIYSLHRARDERIFTKSRKLLGVITEDEIVLALDTDERFPTDGIYLFAPKSTVDIRYLMGVLNSKLFVFIYRLLSMEEGRALAQVKPTLLAKLPIRQINLADKTDKLRHDTLVTMVDKMLALVPKLRAESRERQRLVLENAVQSTDQKIDELIYELYGLSAQERALVENGAKSTPRK